MKFIYQTKVFLNVSLFPASVLREPSVVIAYYSNLKKAYQVFLEHERDIGANKPVTYSSVAGSVKKKGFYTNTENPAFSLIIKKFELL